METEKNHTGFIRTKTAAIAAVVVTGLVAAMTYRRVFFSPPHHYHPHWLIDWSFILPRWTLLPLNIALYAALVSICLGIFLDAKGRERTLVVGWYPGVLLSPVKMYFAAAVEVVNFLDVAGITVALIAAVLIAREFPWRSSDTARGVLEKAEESPVDGQPPGSER